MIVVTTPTGSIGAQVVRRLLADGQDVRVIVRTATGLEPAVRHQVDVVQGSHADEAVLDRALRGADALFWVVPPDPTSSSLDEAYTGFSAAALTAMAGEAVRRVVGVSALGRGTAQAARAGNVTATLALDDRIIATGVAYRALTMPSFMDNVARQAALIRHRGLLTSPIPGDRAMPMVATADVAEVAASWLTDRSWAGAGEVPVLGPADVSFEEMAQVITEVLGRPVAFARVTGPQVIERMTASGMSRAMANGLLEMANAKANGLDNALQRTPDSATPTTFRQWCQSHLGAAVG